MKGLYIKDIRMLMKHKLLFLAMISLTVINSLNLENAAIVPSLMLFFFTSLAFTTITYDEMDHGMTFLFTLPISRKKYVIEKYGLSFVICLIAVGLSFFLVSTMCWVQGETLNMSLFFLTLVLLFIVGMLYISLMLPIYLKFGGDKSRLIMIAVMGVIFFFSFLGGNLIDVLNLDFTGVLQKLIQTPAERLVGISGLITLFILFLSFKLSVRIIQRKEL
ncbi:hypothetical protein NRIC_10350 [Enterococcus florum]|uniref:ABC-2 transporter permease n=1 Tax=Enterococcus florum TaxID=2480627 RepID=A0A4P5P9X2_9ENTE|nr:ABC-2 transporter permease [Enterococcus florum]GCF93144.1 hypothetical protein NRIC_10350 [Enterococcus florum]